MTEPVDFRPLLEHLFPPAMVRAAGEGKPGAMAALESLASERGKALRNRSMMGEALARVLHDRSPALEASCSYCGSRGEWTYQDRNRLPICDAWPACRVARVPRG